MRPSPRSRFVAIAATAGVHLALLSLVLIPHAVTITKQPAERMSVFDVPAQVPPPPQAPVPQPPREEPVTPPRLPVTPPPVTPPAVTPPVVLPAVRMPTPPPPPPPATSAPRPPVQPNPPPPAPPRAVPRPPSAPDVDWNSRLLAHIDRHKRYPAVMGSRRPTGTVYVLFRMNRSGAVLFARIERSSGNVTLDRAALQTIERAAPMPAIPDGKPDEIQLSVPIEFLVR